MEVKFIGDDYLNKAASLGKQGEDAAADYLKSKGYKILCRNYRCRIGEIDIIASKTSELFFVEVKTRRSLTYGNPADAVTRQKQGKIRTTALQFLQEQNCAFKSINFDVIEIFVNGDKMQINHIQQCF
ncbi:MAG: YraN family protein [Acholeplasmataceae bacterium]|nr:YraN family protein [Acholeplasmataceae bacterium]